MDRYGPGPIPGIPQIPDRVDFWLSAWARWYRLEPNKLGYPHKVNGLIGGGESRRTAEWEEDETEKIWHRNCQAMDALVESLPPSQCCAIRHCYLGEVWRFKGRLLELLETASATLLRGMNARAIL